MMRREIVAMGTLAVVGGLVIAVLLTATFGAHSSGAPALLRTTPTEASDAGRVHESAKPHKRKPSHKRAGAAKSVPAPSPAPVPVVPSPVTQPRATTVEAPVTVPQQKPQTVTTPAPRPAPVRPLSRPAPKRTGGGGTFDDSG